jgi:hypothetical protein
MDKMQKYNIGYRTWTQEYTLTGESCPFVLSQQKKDKEIEDKIYQGNLSDANKIIGIIMGKDK